jgi:ATP-dependent RNA helicase DeaD
VEQDERETTVGRSQNVVYVLPHDWASIVQFLGPLMERIDPATPELQLLVVTPDAEAAAAVAGAAVRIAGERGVAVAAATSTRRTMRLLRTRPCHLIAGTPETLLELIRGAAVKLDSLRGVALTWVDDLLATGGGAQLETLMSDLPKDIARVVVASELTPSVEELIERYARRARRVVAPPEELATPTAIEFVVVSQASKPSALRRLLDDLDPRTAFIYAHTAESESAASALVQSLGYGAADSVRVGRTVVGEAEVAVLFDLPASREDLRAATGEHPGRVVALVPPRQLRNLRQLAAGGAVVPIVLPEAAIRARGREAATRAELQETLRANSYARELLTLEPLLDEYDGIEIAAAALQLYEREHARASRPAEGAGAVGRAAPPMVRLFVNLGERDNVRPGDLVGAITATAGLTSAELGRIDVRESHSLVEVAASAADTVVDKLTGTNVRGRRAIARIDEQRPARRPEEASRGERGGRGERPDRGARGGDRGGRGAPRDRGERGAHGARDDRGERSFRGARSERPDRPRASRAAPERRGRDRE